MPLAAWLAIAALASLSFQRFSMPLFYSSGWMPASLAIFTQVAISWTWYGRKLVGFRGSIVKPNLSMRAATSGFLRLATISPDSRSRIGCGVAAGAKKPAHEEALASFTPCSSRVGTLGRCGLRLGRSEERRGGK